MTNLTVIIPLVAYVDDHKTYYDRSINSLVAADAAEELSVIFVGPDSALKAAKEYDLGKREVLYLTNNKNTDLANQVTKAVKDVKTEWFSVLEFDDDFMPYWFSEVEKYMASQSDTALFLPLMEVYDQQKPELGAVAYANEPVWASSFSEEIGFIDTGALKNHYNFIVSGGVFRKSDFVGVGGLKCSIKVFFWYELLLRLCHNGKKVFVIPKVGYNHYVNREGSLTSIYQGMEQAEIDFWFSTAQDEYVYKTDRKKTYEATPAE